MAKFVTTQEFKDLNIGFSMDEGIPSADDSFVVFYAERTTWSKDQLKVKSTMCINYCGDRLIAEVEFKINGNTGHGSILLKDTVGEKLVYLMTKMNDFRTNESERLHNSNGALITADVTTVNLTMLNGGVQLNVVPAAISVSYDVRLAIDVNVEDFEAQLQQWASEAGSDIEVVFLQKEPFVGPTELSDANPFWVAFKGILIDEL